MLGFSRAELWLLRALPLLLMALGLLLLLTKSCWLLLTPTAFSCYTPQYLNSEQAAYVNRYCEKSDVFRSQVTNIPERKRSVRVPSAQVQAPDLRADEAVLRLLSVALVLGVPLAAGDLLRRAAGGTRAARYRDVSRGAAVFRAVAVLLCRLIAAIFLFCAGLFLKQMEPFLNTRGAFPLYSYTAAPQPSIPGPVTCDFEAKKLGKNMLLTVQCHVRYGPHVLMTNIFLVAAWLSVAAALVWIVANGVLVVILLIVPASRKSQLAFEEEVAMETGGQEKTEDVRMSGRF